MSYRTILVYVDGSDAGRNALNHAARLAQDHDAKLIGLHAMTPSTVQGSSRVRLNMEIAEALSRRRIELAERAETQFREATRALPRTAWQLVELQGMGDIPSAVTQAVRCADLAVVGQIGEGERLAEQPGALPEQLVLQSGKPILVVPPATTQTSIGQRVLVGWDQSREAARALADAMPLLEHAAQVWVLTIREREDEGRLFAGGDGDHRASHAVDYLTDHHVKAVPLNDTAGELKAGEILLARAADQTADLIVLGAYGHSRLREMVLGGVTRDILSHMTVPVLMSH